MLAKRIIPCLDVNRGRVVKGTNFVNLRDAGDPIEIARMYQEQGADELVFLDITASHEGRDIIADLVRRVAEEIFMPFCVGGGIRTLADATRLIQAGAEKVSLNTSAVQTPELITQISQKFGANACVVNIDPRRISPLSPGGRGAGGEGVDHRMYPDSLAASRSSSGVNTSQKPLTPNPSPQEGEGNNTAPLSLSGRGVGGKGGDHRMYPDSLATSMSSGGVNTSTDPLTPSPSPSRGEGSQTGGEGNQNLYEVYTHGGRTPTGLEAIAWAIEVERLGAGEIVLTCMDNDGTKNGYDVELTRRVAEAVNIPVVASGGAGHPEHLYQVLTVGKADAALAASIFHYGEFPVPVTKRYLAERGVVIRL